MLACPSAECSSYGYYTDKGKCYQKYECSDCLYQWRTAGQDVGYWETLKSYFRFGEMRVVSNIYKLLQGGVCPQCRCFIQRSGGCNFMECPLCKYQFCWYCQDAFYTEYHYNGTDCPFRLLLVYVLLAMCGLIAHAKLFQTCSLVYDTTMFCMG